MASKTALELIVGDYIDNRYEVTWISNVELRNKMCFFDVRDHVGKCVKKVECLPSTTFKIGKK